MAIDLNKFIADNNIGYLHAFGDNMTLTAEMLKSVEKSKTDNKYIVHAEYKGKDEVIDYLTGKDLIALRDGKGITCTWTRSKASGKPYWNHSAQYVEDEVE